MMTRLFVYALLTFLAVGWEQVAAGEGWPVAMAIADFDNFDTTGEDAERSAAHAGRVKAFADFLRNDIAADARFTIVPLTCGDMPCSPARTRPATFLEAARAAGARYLVYGGIHKQSTLVQWALVHAIDLEKDKLVLERTFSLRGDTDEAFRRAADFIVEYVKKLPVDP
jgi:hypothetical protein